MPKPKDGKFTPASSLDRSRFNDLFLDAQKNREEIGRGFVSLVNLAAARIHFRCDDDANEAKGEALEMAVSLINSYDTARCRAISYFYEIIRRTLLATVEQQRSRPTVFSVYEHQSRENSQHDGADSPGEIGHPTGDGDSLDFDRLYRGNPKVSIEKARSAAPQNWHSYRLTGAMNIFRTEKYYRTIIARAKREIRQTKSPAERAAGAFIIEASQQACRALLGRRLDVKPLSPRKSP